MDRREFLKAAGVGAGVSLLESPLAGAQPGGVLPARLIPVDKGITPEMLAAWRRRGERRVYRGPNLYAIGMPVGGICSGQLYVLGDGTLGGWHVDGRLNSTGHGSANYATKRAERELAQGFAIQVGEGSETERATLDEAGGWNIDFIGEYPVAHVRYRRGRQGAGAIFDIADLEVDLRAYSPFCPLNARESAAPCTILRFTLRNGGAGRAIGALVGRLENGVELAAPGEIQPRRRNRVVSEDGLAAVFMDAVPTEGRAEPRAERLIADFEGEKYVGWKAEGMAFGDGPVRGTQPNQHTASGFAGARLVNSFTAAENTQAGDRPTGKLTSDGFRIDRDYLTFLIGGGAHRGQTCLNLLVDGRVVRTATGKASEKLEPFAWDVREFADKQGVLQIVDAASGAWGHVNVDQIVL